MKVTTFYYLLMTFLPLCGRPAAEEVNGDGVALSQSSDALIGFAAAHQDQSPHVEYHFTVNYMINEGAPLHSEQVALRARTETTSSCGCVCKTPGHEFTLFNMIFCF